MKNIYTILFLLIFLGSIIDANAQQQNRFWYFGNNIGIDFGQNLDEPQPIDGIGNNTVEGSGVISDNSGDFLFYTDGNQAINNLNNTFGTNLGGSAFSTQSSIAVPDPANCEDYFIISVGAYEDQSTWGLFYAKINSTSWTVLETGELGCPTCVEKITAIPHANGSDYWILSIQPNSSTIPVYLLNENGINRMSNSLLDLPFSNEIFPLKYGAIKGSHNGDMFAVAFGDNTTNTVNNRVDLFSFDNKSGTVTGKLHSYAQNTAYGIEFSPNDNYLFISGIGRANLSTRNGSLGQYELTSPFSQINFLELNSSTGWDGGALQLGPDNKIYLARDNSNTIDRINNPNSIIWDYETSAVSFNCNNCVRLGLPNLVANPNECDPCDISNSLIPNPGFEELANGIEPDAIAQLDRAADWTQATDATSDYYSLLGFSNRDNGPGELMEMPPMLNESSQRWVGGWRDTDDNSIAPEDYIEYIGAELLSTLRADTIYTLKLKVGAPRSTTINRLPEVLDEDLVVLGLPNNTIFPIEGADCKQNDGYEEIGRVSINIPEFSWREITIELQASQDYNKIMFGLSCDTQVNSEFSYFLVDDLLLIQGEDPCPSACYTITADAPVCNEDNASYTYDFSLINNMEDNSFDKLLILDQDEGFSLDLDGQTLLQLDDTVGPGQSIDLSWTIEGTSSEEAEFCFDIIPYNPAGEMCCKEQHCVTLESCCMGDPIATLTTEEIDLGENACCYAIDYENICLPDYYTRLQVQMMTPGLGLSVGTLANSDFTATMINPSLIELTYNNGATFPEGIYDDVMSYCVSDLAHTSPDMQEVRYSWFASVDEGPEAIVEINTETAMCPLPMAPDTCTVISEDMLYCDDNGVYHYRFKVTNLSQGEYDATVLVIGPLGDTEPSDFSQQTFPDFPDNTPGASPFLEYGETTDFLDVALPNASLGDSYSFFLSMHDYRMPLDDGDYWCCFDTLDVITLDIDFPCSGSGITESPLDHEVYPNPVQDNFTLRFKRRIPADAEIVIMNTGGKIMDTYAVEKDTHFHTVDTGVYLPGLYYIMVRDEMGAVTYSKFVRR